MSDKPMTRLQREGNYLGGLFHQNTIFAFGLRALFDLCVVVLSYALTLRILLRQHLLEPCCLACLIESEQQCCLFSLGIGGIVALVVGVGFATSAMLTRGTASKLFLRSTVLTALTVVTLLGAGLYFSSALPLVILLVPVIFISMFAGYRMGLVLRRKRRG
jgi:hypothetical protein